MTQFILAEFFLVSEIALVVGVIGGVVGLIGLILASIAHSGIANLRREMRNAQSKQQAERAALRAELLAHISKQSEKPTAESQPPVTPIETQSSPVPSEEVKDASAPPLVHEVLDQAEKPPHAADRTSTDPPFQHSEQVSDTAATSDMSNAGMAEYRPQPLVDSTRKTSAASSPATPPTHKKPVTPPAHSKGNAGFEQFLGTKMLVWLGGLALTLAMGFFVHHAFKNNWITPEIRIIGGAAFSFLLIAGSDFLRKKADAVAQAMSGAGIAGLYVVIYSANHFYGYIDSPVDFLLSLVVTAGAVVLALRHGPFTAVLGMLGGFVMPVLLRTGDPAGGTFFGYLILLQLGLVALGRRRHWRWLSLLSLIFGSIWGGMSALDVFPITARVWPEALFIGMAAVYVYAVWPTQRETSRSMPVWLGFVGVCVSLLLMLAHVSSGEYEPRGLGMLGLLTAASLVLARLDSRFLRLPWAALAAVAGMLMAYSAWGAKSTSESNEYVTGFAVTAGAYAAVLVLGSWACTWRNPRTTAWAWLSVASGIVVSGLVISGLWNTASTDFAWWALTAGASALYAVMAAPRFVSLKGQDQEEPPGADAAIGVWAIGSVLFAGASVALAAYDQMPWMRVGWAALALAVWAVYSRLAITTLRGGVVTLAALVGLCTIWPGPFFEPIASTPVWNQLLLGYGGSAALLGLIAWRSCRRGDPELSESIQAITLVVMLITPAVLIRHGFVGDEWDASYSLYESATHALAWLLLGMVTIKLGAVWKQHFIVIGGVLYGVVGTLVAVVGSGLVFNPLWNRDPVGTGVVMNGLLYVYLLPSILALSLGAIIKKTDFKRPDASRSIPPMLGVACLLLVFAWVSLTVRQGFVGPVLHLEASEMSSAEWYAYSVAWVALGTVLLIIGVVTGRPIARWGSLALMMLSVIKVFIFDAAGLRDLYRVLSFLGLGISLIALGYVYQRFVFKKAGPSAIEGLSEGVEPTE